MIQQLAAKNFRVFKDKTTFKLAPITVLTGTNNSGKSSINTLIELIKDIFSNCSTIKDLLNQDFNKNTDFIKKYGGLKNLFTRGSVDEGLTFSFALYIKELYDYVNVELTIDNNLKIAHFTITTQEEDEQLLKIYYDDDKYLCNINFSFLKQKLTEINVSKYIIYNTLNDAEKHIKESFGEDFEVLKSQIETDLLTYSEQDAIERAEKKLKEVIEEELSYLDNGMLKKYNIEVIADDPHFDISFTREIYIEFEFKIKDYSISGDEKRVFEFLNSFLEETNFFNLSFLFSSDNENFNKEFRNILKKEFGKGFTDVEYLSRINDLIIDKLSEDFELNYDVNMYSSNFKSKRNYILDAGLKAIYFDVYDSTEFMFMSLLPRDNYFNDFNFIEKLKFLCILKFTNNENFLFESNNGDPEFIAKANHILVGNNDFKILDTTNTDLLDFIKKDILEKYFFNLQWIRDELNSIDKITTIKTVSKRNHAISDTDGISKIIANYNQLNELNKLEIIKEVNSLIRYFGIGESIEINCDQEKDSYSVYLIRNDKQKYLIDDNGHGIMQLIPLLLRIILNKDDKKILKLSILRWVCAPQYTLAGTFTSPMVSFSIRYSMF